jgi:hypothetical protein
VSHRQSLLQLPPDDPSIYGSVNMLMLRKGYHDRRQKECTQRQAVLIMQTLMTTVSSFGFTSTPPPSKEVRGQVQPSHPVLYLG